MTTSTEIDALDRRLQALPVEIAPPRDLWPAIAAELEPQVAPARRSWLWQAAAAAVLVVASSVVTTCLAAPANARPWRRSRRRRRRTSR